MKLNLSAFALLICLLFCSSYARAQSPDKPAASKSATKSTAPIEPTVLDEDDTIVIEAALAAQKAMEEHLTKLFERTFQKYGKDPSKWALAPMKDRRNLWSFQQRETTPAEKKDEPKK